MNIETEKDNICINKLVIQKKQDIFVEGDIIVPDVKPDIITPINTSGNICTYKQEILDGKIRLDGSIETYIIYLTDENNIRSLNYSLDFTELVEVNEAKQNMDCDIKVSLKNVDCKVLNGRKVNVKAILDVEIRLYSNENIEFIKQIKNIEDMQKLNKMTKINSLLGIGNTKAVAKDTINIGSTDVIVEILKVNFNIINVDSKISYNKVLTKAEGRIKILYLTEDERICSVESNIPIMGFIDIQNVKEGDLCDINCSLKNMIIKSNDVSEHTIYVEIESEFESHIYEEKNIEIIEDIYNPNYNIGFNKKELKTITDMQYVRRRYNMDTTIQLEQLGNNQIYDCDVDYNIQDIKIMNRKVLYEGELILKIIYESNSSKIDYKTERIPFNYEIEDNEISQSKILETELIIENQNIIIMSDGNVNAKIDLNFNLQLYKRETISVIENISAEEKTDNNQYSIIIYFVKEGDSLWKIAKEFDTTIDEIKEINELEDDMIVVGQKLLVPRHINKKKGIA